QARLVRADRDAGVGGGGHQRSAGVGELDGGGDVAGREDRLDRDRGGPALFEQRGGAAEEEVELGGESERGGGAPDSAPHQREPGLLEADPAASPGRGARGATHGPP